MVSFEIFVKSMPPSFSILKVIPSFCFAFKIPDDVTATNTYCKIGQSVLPSFLIISGYDGASTVVHNENYCHIFVLFIYFRGLMEMVWNTASLLKVFKQNPYVQ